jgi:hypothetical protein
MTRVLVVCSSLLLPSALFAEPFWTVKPYSDWTREEALKVLQDSPWVMKADMTVRELVASDTPFVVEEPSCCEEASPLEGNGAPSYEGRMRSSARIRETRGGEFWLWFLTATPVRMAMARLAVLKGEMSEAEAVEILEKKKFPGAVVLVLTAAEPEDCEILNRAQPAIQGRCFIQLKKSKRKVPLFQYVSPSQSGSLDAYFVFPRQVEGREVFAVDEEEVRFVAEFSSGVGIEKSFRLREMVFRGVLEL